MVWLQGRHCGLPYKPPRHHSSPHPCCHRKAVSHLWVETRQIEHMVALEVSRVTCGLWFCGLPVVKTVLKVFSEQAPDRQALPRSSQPRSYSGSEVNRTYFSLSITARLSLEWMARQSTFLSGALRPEHPVSCRKGEGLLLREIAVARRVCSWPAWGLRLLPNLYSHPIPSFPPLLSGQAPSQFCSRHPPAFPQHTLG